MKAGDLIRVTRHIRWRPDCYLSVGVIVGTYRNEQAPYQRWFRVLVDRRMFKMHESYLEVISESR